MGSDEWVLDSGAAIHLTSDRYLLHEFQPVENPSESVTGPDGMHFPIRGSGSVQTEKFNIPDVHYVPDIGLVLNIISVCKLSYDHNMIALFGPDHCTLVLESGKTAGQAVLRDGIYVLQYLIIGQVRGIDDRFDLILS